MSEEVDYSKQLAEELGSLMPSGKVLWAKAVSLLKENAELKERVTIQEEFTRAAQGAREAFEGDVDVLTERAEAAESSLRVMRERITKLIALADAVPVHDAESIPLREVCLALNELEASLASEEKL